MLAPSLLVDEFIDHLITRIAASQVVPVIGDDLLLVDTPDGPRSVSELVASKVAAKLKLASDGRTVSDLAHAFLENRRSRDIRSSSMTRAHRLG